MIHAYIRIHVRSPRRRRWTISYGEISGSPEFIVERGELAKEHGSCSEVPPGPRTLACFSGRYCAPAGTTTETAAKTAA